ncbi:MAG: response regulator [Alphaproteobacteria bacterium]|nr:response regulator [Alphaproteobacteria bacterium]
MGKNTAIQKIEALRRADGTPRRVLYAEDQTTSRLVTAAMLRRMGFDVDAVEDGELALERARHENYDVILLDIEMPVMDGVTAARSIRADLEHCKGTPILALSAFLADSTEHSKWRDAFDSALPKPANSNELLAAMQRALRHKDTQILTQDSKPAVSASELAETLRGALSIGAWKRLVATAAEEMRQLTFTMGAGFEAGEPETIAHCATGLKGLGLNFGAVSVAQIAQQLRMDPKATLLPLLLAEISAWEKQI